MNQPCPRCGGSDRFFLVSNPRNGGSPFWLCRQCRHYQPATDEDSARSPLRHLSPDEIDQAHAAYGAVARWCADYLWSNDPDARAALDYLRRRGFTDAALAAAQIGYHPACQDRGAGLALYHRDHELWEAAQLGGLLGPQGRLKSVLRGTITIPYWYDGRCTLLRGRPVAGDGPARYLSPGGVLIYAGSAPTLFLADTISKLRPEDPILLCEGEFKALAAHQNNIPAVAQPGIGFLPDAFVQALAGRTIVVAYDVEARADPFELSPGERHTLAAVSRLCGIAQQLQIEQLYKVLEKLEKAKSDDIREQTLVMAQQEAAKAEIGRLKQQIDRLRKLNLRVRVLRLPRRADERKVDLDAFLLKNSADVLRQMVKAAPDGQDWHAAHSGGEFGYSKTGMHNGAPIANYKARIVETVFQHDGLNTATMQRVALQTPSGRRLEVDILDEDWADDRRAVKLIRKGLQEGTFDDTPTHALRAIRLLSNQGDPPVGRRVSTCTGWEQIDNRWHFLAPDGAIHSGGINPTIRAEIDPDTAGNHYAMCGPGDPAAGAAAYLAFLRGDVVPQPLALLLAGQTALAVLHRFNGNAARSMIWLHHETGSLKTATVRASVMALFGPRFTAVKADGAPVIKWDASPIALSLASFYFRDLPLIIDDYKLAMIDFKAATRYIQSYSEGTSRTRATKQLTIEKARPIRVIAFSTAEDVLQGEPGIQARLLSLVLKPEHVSEEGLMRLQQAGVNGDLAAFWRGFIQYLAGILDARGPIAIEEQMQAMMRSDDAALTDHRRTAGSLRQNRAAWLVLCTWLWKYAQHISPEEGQALNEAHLSARLLLTADANSRQRSNRPSQIFLAVLTELLASGELVIEQPEMACSRCDNRLHRARDGWFCSSPTCNYHIPASKVVGFRFNEESIGIFSNKAFREIARVRNDQREPFAYSQTAIWQQLEADGALVERGKTDPQVRKRNPANPDKKGWGKPEFVLLIWANLLETQIEHDSQEIATDRTDRTDQTRNGASGREASRCEELIVSPESTDRTDREKASTPEVISAISSRSVATDQKNGAAGRVKTDRDQYDQSESTISKKPTSRVRHPIDTLNAWRKKTRGLLRDTGTPRELMMDVEALTVEQLQTLCDELERRTA